MRLDPRRFLRILLGLFLLSPFLIWFTRIETWRIPNLDLLGCLVLPVAQAALSTAITLPLGILLALATLNRNHIIDEFCLLAPSVVPPLFLVLACLGLVPGAHGLTVVVALHALMASGLVALAFKRAIAARFGRLAEVARAMGASSTRIWLELGWPILRGDLAGLAVFVFALSLTSFSVPLLLGHARPLTLEVLIYNLIREHGAWDHAVSVSAVAALGLFGFVSILPRVGSSRMFGVPQRAPQFLGFRRGRAWAFVPLGVIIFGLGRGFDRAIISEDWAALGPAVLLSLALGIGVGLIELILFTILAYVSPHARLKRFVGGLVAPGFVLGAFAFVLTPGWPVLKLALVTALLLFPMLYRCQVADALDALADQIAMARTLGAGWGAILFGIVWPQAGPAMLRASGLAGVWASGDHALSGILLEQDQTLPLLVRDLMGHYQFSAAILGLIPMGLVAVVIYLFFTGPIRYVCDS